MEEFRNKDNYRRLGKETILEWIGVLWMIVAPTLILYAVVTMLNLPESVIEVLSTPNPWWKIVLVVVINGVIPVWLFLCNLYMVYKMASNNLMR